MASVTGRGGSRRRRGMSEINMVPFIDVMLVLLIIFMVSAPLITTGVVDLPSVGASKARPARVIEITVRTDESLRLQASDSKESQAIGLSQVGDSVRRLQQGDAQTPVVIAADKQVPYDLVVRVMDSLQKAGVARIGLSVKQGGT